MHLEIFLEEASAETALKHLLPAMLPGVTHRPHVFQGKRDLLQNLPKRLRGLARAREDGWRFVVLVDCDQDDCIDLKRRLDAIAAHASLTPKSGAAGGRFDVLNRIAIEELEAWFIGDGDALVRAFPRLNKNITRKAIFRDPDRIQGGTWEALERALQASGYFRGGLAKVELAQRVSPFMIPERNRSASFRAFTTGLLSLR